MLHLVMCYFHRLASLTDVHAGKQNKLTGWLQRKPTREGLLATEPEDLPKRSDLQVSSIGSLTGASEKESVASQTQTSKSAASVSLKVSCQTVVSSSRIRLTKVRLSVVLQIVTGTARFKTRAVYRFEGSIGPTHQGSTACVKIPVYRPPTSTYATGQETQQTDQFSCVYSANIQMTV